MARALLAQDDVAQVLDAIPVWAQRVVDGCEQAGISTAHRGRDIKSAAATGALPVESDRLQSEFREGPCHDALWHTDVVHIRDLRTEDQWPRYSAKAVEAGIRSVLAYRLHTDGVRLGALNLFSTRPDAFDDIACDIGTIVAAHGAVAYRWAQTEAQLGQAIESRQLIGEAIGIVVERFKLTPEQAFATLTRLSQDTNTKLKILAEQVITTGEVSIQAS